MNESESYQPPVSEGDEVTIRDIMAKRNLSFAEARRYWEDMRAKTNQAIFEQEED